jgi:hypothetical protein
MIMAHQIFNFVCIRITLEEKERQHNMYCTGCIAPGRTPLAETVAYFDLTKYVILSVDVEGIEARNCHIVDPVRNEIRCQHFAMQHGAMAEQ